MRMSSGPSFMNEKPRSASSSCIEETPISSTTPCDLGKAKSVGDFFQAAKCAMHQAQATCRFVHQRLPCGNGRWVTVNGNDLRLALCRMALV